MADQYAARLDFGQLLAAVEDAPPVAAADVLGERLVQALGACEVPSSSRISAASADLGHAGGEAAERTQCRETAERVLLAGTPHGRALITQTVEGENGAGGVRVYARVANRFRLPGQKHLSINSELWKRAAESGRLT